MKISRKLAIQILKYLDLHKDFHFPFRVICKEYADKENDFGEISPGEWKIIQSNRKYKCFELWENLQDLYLETVEFMAKGFIEKITSKSLERKIATLAKRYRNYWKEKLWESEDIEEFGLNEFISGKAEGFEESLEIIRKDF